MFDCEQRPLETQGTTVQGKLNEQDDYHTGKMEQKEYIY